MNNNEKVLVVIDIQKEYNTEGRPFCIPKIEQSLQKASELLKKARTLKWPVVHVQHLQEKGIFVKGDTNANFIDNFEPISGETHVTKENFSSFSSPEFANFLSTHKEKEIVVIGYGSTMCCLSTIIDGYHRGYNFTFVSDASGAKPTATHNTEDLHKAATDILRTFCKVTTSNDI